MVKFINPFPFSLGNLPASYDESLSYLQKLFIFQKKLNEVINNLNELSILVGNLNIEEINNQIAQLQEDFITFENRINNNVQAQLDMNYNQVLNLMSDYQSIFNSNLSNLQSELESQIREIELGNVEAYNPTTGIYENVSKVIMDIYSILRNNAVTCTEFDALELSATEFDSLQISAYNFDVNGKTFLNVA